VHRGDIVRQKITLKLSGDIPAKAPEVKVPEAVRLTVGAAEARLPGIGVRASAEAEKLSPADVELLQALQLDHLRDDRWPDDADFAASWKALSAQAEALGTKLIAAVHLGEDKDKGLERLVAECKGARPPVAVWLIISADKATVQKAREALKPLFPEALIGT